MGELDNTFSASEQEGLKKWCLLRQKTGFQGRPNKPADTCYSFWIGASLQVRVSVWRFQYYTHDTSTIVLTVQLLGAAHLVDRFWNRRYVLSTQEEYGGFAKWPDHHPGVWIVCIGVVM